MVSSKAAKPATPEIDWAKIDNLADARAALGVVVNSSEVLGDGSEFITDKNVLVGSPFLILDWRFITDEKTQREYVNVLIMGANGEKARFNDGSTGVYAQLKKVSENTGKVGIQVKQGLRKSDYTTDVNGNHVSATTYYLSA
jgi:hypothetical protein